MKDYAKMPVWCFKKEVNQSSVLQKKSWREELWEKSIS